MNCIHCDHPNTEGWFYCRHCGKRANEPMCVPNLIIRDAGFAKAIRKDQIEFSETTMGEDIESRGGNVSGNI